MFVSRSKFLEPRHAACEENIRLKWPFYCFKLRSATFWKLRRIPK